MTEPGSVDRENALRYMGFKTEPDERMTREIDECEKTLLEFSRPKYVWRAFDIIRENGLRLAGCGFELVGADIANHLSGCEKAAVIAGTLGADTDRLIKRLGVGDSLKAVICDALASAYIEQIMEQARREISEQLQTSVSWSYAAGYGDFPVDMNSKLVECVDAARKIGLSVTGFGMFTPSKSIVGISGLSDTANPSALVKNCENCSFRENCAFRKSGKTCK